MRSKHLHCKVNLRVILYFMFRSLCRLASARPTSVTSTSVGPSPREPQLFSSSSLSSPASRGHGVICNKAMFIVHYTQLCICLTNTLVLLNRFQDCVHWDQQYSIVTQDFLVARFFRLLNNLPSFWGFAETFALRQSWARCPGQRL